MKKITQEVYSKLGANERAIIDKVKILFLRNVLIIVIGIKLLLQWTGWLQYLFPTPILLVFLLLSLIAYLFGSLFTSSIFLAIGMMLLLRMLFDIITVKFKIRLPESRPKRKDNLNSFELMRVRHSCRSYQTKKIDKQDYEELMGSIHKHLSESKFSEKKIRLEYISSPVRVWPVVNASEFIVAIAPKEYNRMAVMDVGRTLQKVVIDATRMGIATCWIGPGADHKSITSKLNSKFNPEKDNIICIVAIGYESKYNPLFISFMRKKMRSRLPIQKLFFDSYGMDTPINSNQEPYNVFGRTFESCQWAPSSYNGQTTRGVLFTSNNKVSRIDFLASTSSKYYAAVATGIWCANWEMGCNELNIVGEFKKINFSELPLTKNQKKHGVPAYDISWVLKL